MLATLYSTPAPEADVETLGEVRLRSDGHAEWDKPLDGLMAEYAARTDADPARGRSFITGLAQAYRNAPYLWAEVSEDQKKELSRLAAQALEQIERHVKYSEDQPRDEQGRWSETGADGGAGTRSEGWDSPEYAASWSELPDTVYHVAPTELREEISREGLDPTGHDPWNLALSEYDREQGGHWNPETQRYEGAGSEDYTWRPQAVYVFADGAAAAQFAADFEQRTGEPFDIYGIDATALGNSADPPGLIKDPELIQQARIDERDMEEPARSPDEVFDELAQTDYGEGEHDYRQWAIERVPPDYVTRIEPYELKDSEDWTDEDWDAYGEAHPEEFKSRKYSEDQPRDEQGRWTSGGAGDLEQSEVAQNAEAMSRVWNGSETVGEWVNRHGLDITADNRVVMWHGRPEESAYDNLRAGSYLGETADDARFFAGRDRGLEASQIEVLRLEIRPEDLQPGVFATLRNTVTLEDLRSQQTKSRKYSDDQPRDEYGRWSETGADGGDQSQLFDTGPGEPPATTAPPGSARAAELLENLNNAYDTPEEIGAALKELGADKVEFPGSEQPAVYVATDAQGDPQVIEWDGESNISSVSNAYDWVGQQDPSDFYPNAEDEWNKEFWDAPETLYHETTEDHLSGIEASGLESRAETRGISNAYEGAAVYTSSDPDDMGGAYGGIIIAIDTAAMAADGLTPYVSREPDIVQAELAGALASHLGIDDFDAEWEGGMSPYTVVVNGDIPSKYVSVYSNTGEKARKYAPDQPRDEQGRWTDEGPGGLDTAEATMLAEQAQTGGFSYQPFLNTGPKSGYMVAGIVPPTNIPIKTTDVGAMARQIVAFADSHADRLASDRSIYIGGWASEGMLVLELAENVADRQEAEDLGRTRNQIAIWDVEGGAEVQTGGSGEYTGKRAAAVLPSPRELGRDDRRGEAGLGARGSGRDHRALLELAERTGDTALLVALERNLLKSFGDPGNTQERVEGGRFGPAQGDGETPTESSTWQDPGERPPFNMENHAPEDQWERAMAYGVSLGHITPQEAEARGWYAAGGARTEDIQPLPPTLYHATPAMGEVLREGLRTRDEEGGRVTSLGGGTSDTISFTTDAELAQRIADTLIEAHQVITGEITTQDIIQRAEAGGFYDMLVQFNSGAEAFDRYYVREQVFDRGNFGEPPEPTGWHPAPGAYGWLGGDGNMYYNAWERDQTEEEKTTYRFDLYRDFLAAQEASGGPADPLFFSPSIESLRNIDPSEVGVVVAHPVEGARGYPTSGMNEWRIWTGDAVTIEKLVPRVGKAFKYDPDQARDEYGRWTDEAGGILEPAVAGTETRANPEDWRAAPTSYTGITPAAGAALDAKLEQFGVSYEGVRAEIFKVVDGLPPEKIAEAEAWYPNALKTAESLAEGKATTEQAAAVIAAMSPQCEWETNIADAQRLIDFYDAHRDETWSAAQFDAVMRKEIGSLETGGRGMTAFSQNGTIPAFEILMDGATIDENLSGMKVRSFFDNIMEPGGTREVTIDGHMQKVFGFMESAASQSDSLRLMSSGSEAPATQYGSAGYIVIADAVRGVADELGMSPDAVQAAYWGAVRDQTPEGWKK